jgi:hypothetical protein
LRSLPLLGAAVATLAGGTARADEGGSSFWVPGTYASFAAMPSSPGWSVQKAYYHANASTTESFSRGGQITAGLRTISNLVEVSPIFVPRETFLGAQAALGLTFQFGNNAARETESDQTATGDISSLTIDSMTGIGDLSPIASLYWSFGNHNLMSYLTANVPAGAYAANRLAGVGLGYWAIDGGGAYTWYDQESGREASITVGMTYNFMNPSTAYRSGMSVHVEVGASQALSEQFWLGIAGYFYSQITPDSGPGNQLGPIISRVAGVGPQLGYSFDLGGRQASLGARGYWEFAGLNRPEGWNFWLTLSVALSPSKGQN